jgi:hypothetical protein
MKKLLIVLLLLFFPHLVFGATTWTTDVTQAGGGGACADAGECSIAEFNELSGDYSNSVFNFSGTITTAVNSGIYGTSGNVVTLDGWAGGSCDPVADGNCASAAVLEAGMLLAGGVDYITIQDMSVTSPGNCLKINSTTESGTSSYITIQRTHFYNAGWNLFQIWYDSGSNRSNYITIDSNRWEGYGETDWGPPVSLNAPQGINISGVNDLVVTNNVLGGDAASYAYSDNVIELHRSTGVLFEYNEIHGAYTQSGLAVKEANPGVQDLIIRFNKIYDNGIAGDGRALGIGWYTSGNFYIYANFMYANGDAGITLGDGLDNVWIWSNIISDNNGVGFADFYRDPGLTKDNINLINNTFYRNGVGISDGQWRAVTAISFPDNVTTNITVKNNIFSDNRPNASNYNQIYVDGTILGDGDLEHNTYYYNGQTANMYYDGADRSLATLQGTYNVEDDDPIGGGVSDGEIADPGFTDANGADNTNGTEDDDFTLDGTNINDGADLSQCFGVTVQEILYTVCLDDALDPLNTDWTTTPPTVATVKQDSYGASWERGAYAHLEGVTPPELSTAVIDSLGTTLTLTFDTDVYDGSDYQDEDWNVDCDLAGAGVTVTYVSGKDTSTWTFTLDTKILSEGAGDTNCNIDMTDATDSMENSVGDAMAVLTDGAVTNNSTQTAGTVTLTTTVGGGSETVTVGGGSQTVTIE